MYLVLTHTDLHIFDLAHWIRIKMNNLETEGLLFETNVKLYNIRFEKIKTWEGVSQSWESHNEILVLKTLGKIVLVNNLLQYFYTAKICSYEFCCLRDKMVKFFFHFHKFKRKKNICTLAIPYFTYHMSPYHITCTTLFHYVNVSPAFLFKNKYSTSKHCASRN